ncbi:MAG TPA: hypothetical protein PLK99_11020, partial [Burkholderiales bacterium]|nr:hypothetical protein [Burkholderiales bacterium]
EGVETVAHGTMLLHMGCDLAQGFGIAHPMTAEQISDWVRDFDVPSDWRRASIKPRSPMRDTNFVFAEVELRRCVDDWIALTRSASAGMTPVPVKECPFHKWLLGPGKAAFGHLAGFSVIESMQAEVHAMGSGLVDLCMRQQYAEARAKIPELLGLRDKLIESLYGLIESAVPE